MRIALFCLLSIFGIDSTENVSPIIGIVSQPSSTEDPTDIIAQSYAGFLSMGGARVVPVLWNDPAQTNRQKMDKLNGLLFMGGSFKPIFNNTLNRFNPYAESVCDMVRYATQLNTHGHYFPLYGVCYGYEVLASCLSDNPGTLMGNFSDHQTNDVLRFTAHAKNTTLFGYGTQIYTYFSTMRVSHFNHEHGISKTRWFQDTHLTQIFNVLAYQSDDYGDTFVAAIESTKYPYVGLQFHPEKNSWEFNPEHNYKHFYEAVMVEQWVSDYVVNSTRKSEHHWDEKDAHQNLIWRHDLIDGTKYGYEQVYKFDE